MKQTKPKRKRPCDNCKETEISIEQGYSFSDKKAYEHYDEYCTNCGCLLYGYSKRFHGDLQDLMQSGV